ncbi:MAG: hypothetical protein HGA47_07370 [Zoogloea sp.]|nr:hypothetical protein [Zoogloea sp.]
MGAQYGMALLVVGLPFYCFAVAAFIWLVHKAIAAAGFHSFWTYIGSALLASLLLALVLVNAQVGWVSSIAAAISLLSALILAPVFEGTVEGNGKAAPVLERFDQIVSRQQWDN